MLYFKYFYEGFSTEKYIYNDLKSQNSNYMALDKRLKQQLFNDHKAYIILELSILVLL